MADGTNAIGSVGGPTSIAPAGQPVRPTTSQPAPSVPASQANPTGFDAGSALGGGIGSDLAQIGADVYSSLVGKVSGDIKKINDEMIGLINSNGGNLDAGTAALFSSRISNQTTTLEFLKKMHDEEERGRRAWST